MRKSRSLACPLNLMWTSEIGGYDEQGSRTAIHQALAGYHRMFFERNLPVDILSSRELADHNLSQYKLVIVPYPLMLSSDEALILKQYVAEGGHLFVEARPGWVDERGYAEARIPGFGWDGQSHNRYCCETWVLAQLAQRIPRS